MELLVYSICMIISLSIMSSYLIFVVVYVRIIFLFKTESYSIENVYYILFIHSSINGHVLFLSFGYPL